jgi:hypothetical protein
MTSIEDHRKPDQLLVRPTTTELPNQSPGPIGPDH